MNIYDSVDLLKYVVLAHLVLFVLSLAVLVIYIVIRAAFKKLTRVVNNLDEMQHIDQRIQEIRSIGADARDEMRRLNREYLHWLNHS